MLITNEVRNKSKNIYRYSSNNAEEELKEERTESLIAISTIWDVEETWKYLEYDSKQGKLAESFLSYKQNTFSKTRELSFNDAGIQIFLTTHSPVFSILLSNSWHNPKITSFSKKKDLSSDIKSISNDETISYWKQKWA